MKKYKIERDGDFWAPMYYLTVFCGKKALRFQVDSGCGRTAIIECELPSKTAFKTNELITSIGFDGSSLESQQAILPICLEDGGEIFELTVSILPKSNSKHYIISVH